ncbi:MAG: hypothetical protein NUV67_01740 [archaeon]|nr:hypothetical protein [archaeon]
MKQNQKILAGIILLAGFLSLAIFSAPLLGFKLSDAETCEVDNLGNVISCPHEQQVRDLEAALPLVISIAIVVGAGTYYLMSGKVESTEKSLKKNTDVILKLLNSEEKKLVNLLIENNGKILQAEVTRLPGMTKVKSHRVVQKLIDRGVLEKESVGKTNVLKFTQEIKEGLL